MDEAAVSQPDPSFYPFEHGVPSIGQLGVDRSNPTINDPNEAHLWLNDWRQNGFYSGDSSSSQLSLPQGLISTPSGSSVSSKASWTEDDDTGSTFFEIPQMLQAFVLTRDEASLTIPALNSQQRRVVHGMAHMMRLGHTSYKSEGKVCRMHIFKKDNSASTRLPEAMISEQFMADQMDYCDFVPLESTTSLPDTLPSNRISRGFKHRIRLPKRENGYPCRATDCFRMFHRACDRDKHEQRHANKDNHPHKCFFAACKKTFMYPKDLRRHQQVHARQTGQYDGADGYSSEASSCSESPSLTTTTSSTASTPSSFLSDLHIGEDLDLDLTPMPKTASAWSYFEAQRDFEISMEKGWQFH